MSIGQNIRVRRLENLWSQQELGLKVGVTQELISQYEGDKKAPSLAVANALSEVFGCTLDELVKGTKIIRRSTHERTD